MAQTTTTSVTSAILAKYIEQQIRESLQAALVLPQMVVQADLRGKNSKVWSSNKWASLTAAGVAETADITGTEATVAANDITVSEVGIAIDVTDLSAETSGITPDRYAEQGKIALAQKMELDLATLFSGFSTSVGTTATELSLDTLISAIQSLETANATGAKWIVLHPRQVGAYRRLIAGTTGSTAAFYGSSGVVDPAIKSIPGFVDSFLGIPMFMSTQVQKINTNVDYCGALFTSNALGMATLRDVRVEPDRDASTRVTQMVVTSAYGVGELDDACGVRIISKVA